MGGSIASYPDHSLEGSCGVSSLSLSVETMLAGIECAIDRPGGASSLHTRCRLKQDGYIPISPGAGRDADCNTAEPIQVHTRRHGKAFHHWRHLTQCQTNTSHQELVHRKQDQSLVERNTGGVRSHKSMLAFNRLYAQTYGGGRWSVTAAWQSSLCVTQTVHLVC